MSLGNLVISESAEDLGKPVGCVHAGWLELAGCGNPSSSNLD